MGEYLLCKDSNLCFAMCTVFISNKNDRMKYDTDNTDIKI